jgi:hypothetical protein
MIEQKIKNKLDVKFNPRSMSKIQKINLFDFNWIELDLRIQSENQIKVQRKFHPSNPKSKKKLTSFPGARNSVNTFLNF